MILCCKIECLKKKVLFEDKDVSVLLHILKVYDTCTANTICVKYLMVKETFNLNGYKIWWKL
jgi:hypothetical protein